MMIKNDKFVFGEFEFFLNFPVTRLNDLRSKFSIRLIREYDSIKHYALASDIEYELNAELVFIDNGLIEVFLYLKHGVIDEAPFSKKHYDKESKILKNIISKFSEHTSNLKKVKYFDDFKTGSPYILISF